MSSQIRNIINEKYLAPNNKSNSTYMITGKVIDVNEDSYQCKVEYIDSKNGIKRIRDNVQVISYNKSVIDWFPKNGESVNLQLRNNTLVIIGPADSANSVQRQLKLQNDIFSDTYIDGVGGYIF